MAKESRMLRYGVLFGVVIVLSNYLFQFRVNEWVTYGALLFPLTFLITDIIGEKYGKVAAVKVVGQGILFSFIPTLLMVDVRIAIASIVAYLIAQTLDVYIFDYLKNKYRNKWWVRNNISTFVSQFIDTILFFGIAFYGKMPLDTIVSLIVGTIIIKWIIALLDTPIFYVLTQRNKNESN